MFGRRAAKRRGGKIDKSRMAGSMALELDANENEIKLEGKDGYQYSFNMSCGIGKEIFVEIFDLRLEMKARNQKFQQKFLYQFHNSQ